MKYTFCRLLLFKLQLYRGIWGSRGGLVGGGSGRGGSVTQMKFRPGVLNKVSGYVGEVRAVFIFKEALAFEESRSL